MEMITTNGTTASGAGARMAAASSTALVTIVITAASRTSPGSERVCRRDADDTGSPNRSSPCIKTDLFVSLNVNHSLEATRGRPVLARAVGMTGWVEGETAPQAQRPAGHSCYRSEIRFP